VAPGPRGGAHEVLRLATWVSSMALVEDVLGLVKRPYQVDALTLERFGVQHGLRHPNSHTLGSFGSP
jgi:hypothetical protein